MLLDALRFKGHALFAQGRYGEALGPSKEALKIARRWGHVFIEADLLDHLGLTCLELGQEQRGFGYCEKAVTLLERAAETARAQGDRRDVLDYLDLLANLTAIEPERAVTCLQEALEIARKLELPIEEARQLWRLSQAHYETGQRRAALARGREALVLLRKLGLPEASEAGQMLADWRKTARPGRHQD